MVPSRHNPHCSESKAENLANTSYFGHPSPKKRRYKIKQRIKIASVEEELPFQCNISKIKKKERNLWMFSIRSSPRTTPTNAIEAMIAATAGDCSDIGGAVVGAGLFVVDRLQRMRLS
jgi:hypothetical protein